VSVSSSEPSGSGSASKGGGSGSVADRRPAPRRLPTLREVTDTQETETGSLLDLGEDLSRGKFTGEEWVPAEVGKLEEKDAIRRHAERLGPSWKPVRLPKLVRARVGKTDAILSKDDGPDPEIRVVDATSKPGGEVPARYARQDRRPHMDKSEEYGQQLKDLLDNRERDLSAWESWVKKLESDAAKADDVAKAQRGLADAEARKKGASAEKLRAQADEAQTNARKSCAKAARARKDVENARKFLEKYAGEKKYKVTVQEVYNDLGGEPSDPKEIESKPEPEEQ
jgi:hypothetical protein